jgi:hypothetical protein
MTLMSLLAPSRFPTPETPRTHAKSSQYHVLTPLNRFTVPDTVLGQS